jgi:hypothetical protein
MGSTPEHADLVHGRRFRLYRVLPGVGNAAETLQFVCIGKTMSLVRTAEFDDATAAQCANPDAVPDRKSTKRSNGWTLSVSGQADDLRLKPLEDDYEADYAHEYIIRTITDPDIGPGTDHRGFAYVENLTREKNDNGYVTFSAQFRGDGKLTRGVPPAA